MCKGQLHNATSSRTDFQWADDNKVISEIGIKVVYIWFFLFGFLFFPGLLSSRSTAVFWTVVFFFNNFFNELSCGFDVAGVQEKMGIMNKGVIYGLWDYEAQNDDELSMKEGDCMTILRREDEDEIEWWWARLNDKEGYVPRNLLGVSPWYFQSPKSPPHYVQYTQHYSLASGLGAISRVRRKELIFSIYSSGELNTIWTWPS